jgi:hypothetical protein
MVTALQELLYSKLASYAESAVYKRGSNDYLAIGISPDENAKNVNAVSIKSDRSVSFFTHDISLLDRIGIPYVALKDLSRPPSKPAGPRDEDGYNFANLTVEIIENHEQDFRQLVNDSIRIVTRR